MMMMSQQDTSTGGGRRLGDEIETTMKAKIVIARKGNILGFFFLFLSVDRLLEPAVRCSAAGTDGTGGARVMDSAL